MRKKRASADRIRRLFRLFYLKIFRINDSPQKVALGAGLGVFSGILPGTGPIAAVCLAFIFRANRAAALLGSLITNTWLSFFIFLLAIKTGSFMLGLQWEEIHKQCLLIFAAFDCSQLIRLSFLKFALPIIIGYSIIGFILGAVIYLITLVFIIILKNRRC